MKSTGAGSGMRQALGWLVLIGLLLGPGNLAAAQKWALVGATAITAAEPAVIEDSVVLIDNGRIEAVGQRSEVSFDEHYEQVDVRGKWLTPGLIDSNVHLILLTVPEFFIKYEDRLVDIAIQSAQVGLKYGLTTMPDTWGPVDALLEARDRINSGEVIGSRVLVAGNIIGSGGPFSASFMGGWDARGYSLRYGGWVHPAIRNRIDALWEADVGPAMLAMTPGEAADTLRRYIAKGVDFVKIGVSGHGLGSVEPLVFSPAVLQAMAEVVHEAGIPLTTHTFTVESLRLALDMDPDLLVHPNVMSPSWNHASERQQQAIRELVRTIVERDIPAALMSVPERNKLRIYDEWDVTRHPDRPYLNAVMMERKPWMAGKDYDTEAAGLKVWLDAGVRYTLATDQGPDSADVGPVVWGRLGRMHFDRMVGLQDAGEPPLRIIQAATRNGAEAYGLGDEVGSLRAGLRADILVLDRDPLADISNMRRIAEVIKDGVLIDREALPEVEVLKYDPEADWPQ
ncbi:amidohydrolase family protein [Elongatibacter sediminis]|uniref:Amidohydrolase family protein n=1 Tax=Elongatibacter sediminis TaxID=3119006 RepID=A0AAW9RMD5_9GAMM